MTGDTQSIQSCPCCDAISSRGQGSDMRIVGKPVLGLLARGLSQFKIPYYVVSVVCVPVLPCVRPVFVGG